MNDDLAMCEFKFSSADDAVSKVAQYAGLRCISIF